jgi:hypothetical protein
LAVESESAGKQTIAGRAAAKDE